MPSAFTDSLAFIDHVADSTISKNSATGNAIESLMEISCLRTDRMEQATNNITATLLYTYPMGMVSAVIEIKNIRRRLPGVKPILLSKAFLEKL